MKKPALQNKDVGVLGMAFRARKVFGTFEKRSPGQNCITCIIYTNGKSLRQNEKKYTSVIFMSYMGTL